ncbi:Cof-type HAD-IIB family hydrolase [Bacillus tuaregi]|uniref:Cof-type HAD-IIB family hydrolase n=1 Tax=Bacillus tuaregi TaxID=1816695 RepID=UPI0008F812FD|nr:Cof-type HAD-IIB family hydrolase [Bacillus tuaregi]
MKCFSIDLDGTLLDSKHMLSDENYQVLQDLKKQGHHVIINTGRAVEDVLKIDAIQGLETPIISINGNIIYTEKRETLFEAALPTATYKELFPILQNLGLWIMVYTNQGGFPCRNPDIQDKRPEEIAPIFQDYDYEKILEKQGLKIYKVMAVTRPEELEKIDQAKKAIEGNLEISYASSFPNNVEFTSVEANKGSALLRYQQLTKQSFSEIYAFGDGGNDVSQFKVATTSIAMGNAPAAVQQEADIITKTNNENGFAYAVKQLIKL